MCRILGGHNILKEKKFNELQHLPSILVPSIQSPPKIELKELPTHLRNSYLGENSTLSVIISSSLTRTEEKQLLRVLRDHKKALGWMIKDIKGISPSICMHKILIEENYKPIIQSQCRLNSVL